MAKSSTSWKKGQSANPGGRSQRTTPDGKTIAELARAHTEDAIKTLVEICNWKAAEPRDRIAASNAILDRGWGKPKESVDVDANVTTNAPTIHLTVTRPAGADDTA